MAGKNSYKLVTHILHTMVYRNGELIAILPPGATEQWGQITAMAIFDLAENDEIDMFGEVIP